MLYIVALSAAFSVGLLVFGVFAALPARNRMMRARMVELGLYGRDAPWEGSYRQSRFQQLVQAAGQRLTGRGQNWSSLRRRLIHAGYRDATALPLFVGSWVTSFVVSVLVGILLSIVVGASGLLGLVFVAWAGFTGFFVPSFLLSRRIALRQKEIVKGLPDALDLMVICVEAGLGLNQALLRVAAEMRHVNTLITEEIAQTNLEIRAGTPRDRALLDMADRTGVPDVRALVTLLIQTERFGTSIAKSLRIHAESLRDKRRQRAEEAAAKTTIKIVFPLALCIFPALFVVVLAPALLQIIFTLANLS